MNTTGVVSFGSGSSVAATHDITIQSSTDQHVTVLSETNGGGLVDFADASAVASQDYDSEVQIGSGVSIDAAAHDLVAESISGLDGNASASGDAAGLGADASATGTVAVGETSATTRTTIGSNARLTGALVSLRSTASGMQARATADADSGAAIAGADAHANVTVNNESTDIVLNAGAWVEGDSVELLSRHQNIDLSTRAHASAFGLYGSGDAPANTDYQSSSKIDVDDGATVAGHSVLVQATQDVDAL